jgi:hypothetical protein
LIHWRENISLDSFAVSDPTVFVLPHANGFSGEAWLNNLPHLTYRPADWTEPARPLAFAPAALGDSFTAFIATNPAPQFDTIPTLEPAPSLPTFYPLEKAPAKSTLRIEGPLAQRRLLAPPSLPVWESAAFVTNSIVQLLVDARGRTVSAVLLAPGMRLEKQGEADATALELAKAARFAPNATEAATVGTLTFEWQTLPLPATNAPPEIP